MSPKTISNASFNDAHPASRAYSTEQAAAVLHVRPQTLRAALCRFGHYYNVVPFKRLNRFLAWPAEQIDAIAHGQVAR